MEPAEPALPAPLARTHARVGTLPQVKPWCPSRPAHPLPCSRLPPAPETHEQSRPDTTHPARRATKHRPRVTSFSGLRLGRARPGGSSTHRQSPWRRSLARHERDRAATPVHQRPAQHRRRLVCLRPHPRGWPDHSGPDHSGRAAPRLPRYLPSPAVWHGPPTPGGCPFFRADSSGRPGHVVRCDASATDSPHRRLGPRAIPSPAPRRLRAHLSARPPWCETASGPRQHGLTPPCLRLRARLSRPSAPLGQLRIEFHVKREWRATAGLAVRAVRAVRACEPCERASRASVRACEPGSTR